MKNRFVLPVGNFSRFIFCALFAITFSTRAAIPPAEELLPSDTLFVLTVPDFSALKTSARQSPQWLFWNDAAMKPFHDKFVSKWKETFAAPLERDLGIKLTDFENLPQGQLTFAVTQNGWDGIDADKTPGIILLLDAKTNSALLKTNLATLRKKWMDAGKPIRTETVRGISFSVVTISSNDIPATFSKNFPKRPPVQELGKEPKPEKPGELVIGQFGSLLIAGNSIEAVAPVVAHLTGSGMSSLSDNATFAADKLSQFRDAPLYFGWFNTKTFFNVLASIPPTPPNPDAPTVFPQPQWGKIFAAAGLTGVNSASFTYRQNHDGALMIFSIAAPESSRAGIFKMLAVEPKSAAPPPFVPANVVKFWRWRVDGKNAWDTLQKMVAGISPDALTGLNAALDMANANAQRDNPGFDIRAYLLGNLGDDFIRFQKLPAGNTATDLNAPSLFLFGTRDGDRAIAGMKTFLSLSGSSQKAPEPRDFLGHKIISIPLPAPRMAGAPAGTTRFLYCAPTDDYVAVTTDVATLEEFLRGFGNPPKPLAGAPGLIDAAQHVGGAGKGLFGYENQREVFRSLFTRLKNQPATGLNNSFLPTTMPKEINDWMDFSLLPDYDSISKYFYFSVFAGDTTTDGTTFKFFAPRPPELK
ncbi:MAG TPA: hypothetical protein VE344_00310 [Methylomirabilota bacterium]|nr:hypothetical protein [Methylomirabilota bacterium]